MNHFALPVTLIILLLCLTGCMPYSPTDGPGLRNPPAFGTEWLDSMIEIANAFSVANTASAPVNPYFVPVGIGLAGVTAMLEALRRKERSGRKHAEHKLNNNNNNH